MREDCAEFGGDVGGPAHLGAIEARDVAVRREVRRERGRVLTIPGTEQRREHFDGLLIYC